MTVKTRRPSTINMSRLCRTTTTSLVAICLFVCIIMTQQQLAVMAQRPLSANASITAVGIFATSTISTPTSSIRPSLRRVVNYAGIDGINLGGSGHQSRPAGSPRKITGGKSSANAIVTLSQMSAVGAPQTDAADNPSPYMAQQGRVVPQRFPPGSALQTLNSMDRGRKHTFNELRRNMSQHNKANWERQGEEPEYSLPMQPIGPDNPKDPIRVLKGVFNKDVSIRHLIFL